MLWFWQTASRCSDEITGILKQTVCLSPSIKKSLMFGSCWLLHAVIGLYPVKILTQPYCRRCAGGQSSHVSETVYTLQPSCSCQLSQRARLVTAYNTVQPRKRLTLFLHGLLSSMVCLTWQDWFLGVDQMYSVLQKWLYITLFYIYITYSLAMTVDLTSDSTCAISCLDLVFTCVIIFLFIFHSWFMSIVATEDFHWQQLHLCNCSAYDK